MHDKKGRHEKNPSNGSDSGILQRKVYHDMLLVIAREPKFHALIVSLELYSVPDI